MKKAIFRTNKGEKEGEIIKENNKTIWTIVQKKIHDEKLMPQYIDNYIKRHKKKHFVFVKGGQENAVSQ